VIVSAGARYGAAVVQTEEHVEVAGATLWTATQGDGVPIVLCHGGPGLSDNLGPVADMVDDLALVHRYDQRGSGRSRSDGPFDIPAFVADLEALRSHWDHERWIVGGHSWGANLALFYALAHRERVLGVIYLAGTGLRWGWQADAEARRLQRLNDAEQSELGELRERLAAGDTREQDRFLRLLWTTDFADRRDARVLDAAPLYAYPRNEEVFRAASSSYKAALDAGIDARLRELDAPLLVVHGVHDTDPARAREVAEVAPRGKWIELDAAHVPWLEQPAALRAHLREFVRDAARASVNPNCATSKAQRPPGTVPS
jgi:proline iminopeptidase